ncbi:DUF3631 domain-containing protein, partial [Patescibacteria group bacterium]|nr:DUF3631 domain-containing protein [Patescibacteria group bacterium]
MTYGIFSTFAPKAIAGIGALPDTIEDRAISITMKRKAPGEKAERFRYRKAKEGGAGLKAALEAWSTVSASLVGAEPDLPEALDDRARDGWEVLLAIADMAGGDWPRRAREAALALSAGREEVDDSLGLRLLADTRDIFQQTQDERLPTAILLSKLNALEESPWGGWRKDKGLSSRNLANLLKPYGISSKTIRMPDGTTPRGYEQIGFVDAFS